MRNVLRVAVLVVVLGCSVVNGWGALSRISAARDVLFSGPSNPDIQKRAETGLAMVKREEITHAVASEIAILIVGAASFVLAGLLRTSSARR
jgi:hypothetical protein